MAETFLKFRPFYFIKMLEKKIKNIWIVIPDFDLGESIRQYVKKILPDAKQWICCREYQLKNKIKAGNYPDLMITNGYCKKICWHPSTDSTMILSGKPKQTAKKNNIPTISPTFFGKYIPQVLAFRLEKYL